eukprot:905619_1
MADDDEDDTKTEDNDDEDDTKTADNDTKQATNDIKTLLLVGDLLTICIAIGEYDTPNKNISDVTRDVNCYYNVLVKQYGYTLMCSKKMSKRKWRTMMKTIRRQRIMTQNRRQMT